MAAGILQPGIDRSQRVEVARGAAGGGRETAVSTAERANIGPELVRARHAKLFGREARVYRAPGRVNLIGEHTDYNDGFVMPAAIGFACWAAASPQRDGKLRVHSINLEQTAEFELDAENPRPARNWTDYVHGVAVQLKAAGQPLTGAGLVVASDVPLGAGLSSSAALEVATAYALLGAAGSTMDPTQIALLCQRAENEFVGMRCGIMDQFVACHAEQGTLLMIDCRSLQGFPVKLDPSAQIVIANTMVRHALTGSEYNERRAQCEEGVRRLRERLPQVRALRDVSPEQLEQNRDLVDETVYRRCRHVVTENRRVEQTREALQQHDLARAGELMLASHASLRDDYQVSCEELDTMVELAMQQPGVFGSRMTGGGFGGCTVSLVRKDAVADFVGKLASEYQARTGLKPEIYATTPAAAAGPYD
jgi:galactokinase